MAPSDYCYALHFAGTVHNVTTYPRFMLHEYDGTIYLLDPYGAKLSSAPNGYVAASFPLASTNLDWYPFRGGRVEFSSLFAFPWEFWVPPNYVIGPEFTDFTDLPSFWAGFAARRGGVGWPIVFYTLSLPSDLWLTVLTNES